MANKKPLALPKPKETTRLTLEAFNNDPQLMLLFQEWIANGFNAGKAYSKFHPDVTAGSARTLAWRMLTKVDKKILMEAYGLDMDLYMKQLFEGVQADKKAILRKYDKEGNIIQELDLSQPDHKTRTPYHDKLGRLLDIEKENGSPITVNADKVLMVPSSLMDKYGISQESGHSSER